MPAVNEFEFRVIGPPGTGKSTYLVDQVQRRVDHWSEQTGEPTSQCRDVLLASLTKTAAAELRTRGLDIPKEQIGTLHSHALHALGKPKLCVSAKSIAQWNKESPLDHWMSAGASAMGDEEIGVSLGQYNGDRLMAEYTTNRCRLTPREDWREPVREFAKAYESWKYRNDYLDYEDLISKAYEEQTDPPGNPSTILGDEQQDSSAADLRLMRYWGSKSNKLILVGDEDQRIFSFRGAAEDGMSGVIIPQENERVLEQSYRVPRAVHAEAMRVIERIETRKQVVYRPRDEDGRVDQALYSMRNNPYEAVYEIERLLQEPDEDPRRPKAMCIFACAYQANPLMAALKSAGIPFWNPYAKERNGFNPLHPGSGISTLDRIIAFLKNSEECHGENANVWTWEQFGSWAEMCSADGWLRHGAKTEIKKRSAEHPGRQMTVEEIESLVSHEDVMLDLADCNLEWLGRHLLEPRRGIYSYVVDIAKKRGYSEVVKNPRVVVGTCHSLKGSEAENVFVCPDLSASGWEAFGNSETRDSIYRLFYVALTRARNRLILTAPSCPQAIIL
jgi:superfamily I DNA/RNA helicase